MCLCAGGTINPVGTAWDYSVSAFLLMGGGCGMHLQAFASPAKVAEMVTKVNEALAGPLQQVRIRPAPARPRQADASDLPLRCGTCFMARALLLLLPRRFRGQGGACHAAVQAVAKMRLYLSNPATHAILLKPVKSNIAEAHGQIASMLQVRKLWLGPGRGGGDACIAEPRHPGSQSLCTVLSKNGRLDAGRRSHLRCAVL